MLVEQLRDKGAIIFAKAVSTEYNGRAGNPGGRHKPEKVLPSVLGYQRSSLGRQPVERLRHDARRLARVELGLRRVGQRQSRAWRASARRPAPRAAARQSQCRAR